jgi:DNA-binding NarL/FixJ family response regulator
VLELLARGRLNKQIAAELGISEQTTKAHVSATLAKLGVRNRTQASLLYAELEIDASDQIRPE